MALMPFCPAIPVISCPYLRPHQCQHSPHPANSPGALCFSMLPLSHGFSFLATLTQQGVNREIWWAGSISSAWGTHTDHIMCCAANLGFSGPGTIISQRPRNEPNDHVLYRAPGPEPQWWVQRVEAFSWLCMWEKRRSRPQGLSQT